MYGSISPLIELGAGFDPEMTARENIYLNGCILGHTEMFMDAHFDEIVEFAEVAEFLDSPIKNDSSGMRARLGFAIANHRAVYFWRRMNHRMSIGKESRFL